MRGLMVRLFGDPATVDIENRILNGLMFIGFLTGLLSTIQSIAIGISHPVIYATATGTLVGLVGYWVAMHARRWRLFVAPIFLLFLALLSFCWITQAGSKGTIGYYFFLLVCYAIVLFKGGTRIAALGILAGDVAALLLIERFLPSVILPYPTRAQRFSDIAFALPLCLFMAATILYVVYEEYRRERQAKDDLLHLVTAEKERVERSMREKQRLLTVVCHDIANALTVLQSEISLAKLPRGVTRAEPFAAQPSSMLVRMRYACHNIEEIINSVRMLEAVEQGRITFGLKPVDLQRVFENAEMLFGQRLSERRMHIEFPELGDDQRYVLAEPRILANQVFNNLISNAIKFSHPESAVVVSVSRQSDHTIIRVADQGIGMSAALIEKLFDLEAKTTRPGTDGEPGTGFGMRTVKSFVDLFGGDIEIASRADREYPTDHGTTVSVRLKSAPR